MTANPVLLRVADDGRIHAANPDAEALLGSCVGRHCISVVSARNLDGSPVCGGTCLATNGVGRARRADGVRIRGQRQRVWCQKVGDEALVLIQPCSSADVWTDPPTPRELEVLKWLSRGENRNQVAKRLGLSPATVRTHSERVRRKLQAKNTTHAVARAMSLGLID